MTGADAVDGGFPDEAVERWAETGVDPPDVTGVERAGRDDDHGES